MTEQNEMKFGEAMEELQVILDEIEGEDVDLDDLADRVERAAELIQVCRHKLEYTELQVSKIIHSLDEEGESA